MYDGNTVSHLTENFSFLTLARGLCRKKTNAQAAAGKIAPRHLGLEGPLIGGLRGKVEVEVGKFPVAGTVNLV